jgi:CDP-diacylglycerol---serine O-phosphatidyltransferase
LTFKKHIPNSLTLLNLLFGCIAVLCFFLDYVVYIPFLTALSLLADFLDGLAARALNVSSPIGKELDSLADAVSFGVVPAIALVYLITYYTYPPSVGLEFNFAETLNRIDSIPEGFLILFPLILALFSVLRLAKFNISTDQTTEFKGLATPASTIFVM